MTELADRPRGVHAGRRRRLSKSALAGGNSRASCCGAAATSKKVQQRYDKLLAEVGPELYILREAESAEISAVGGELLARAIAKMRAGAVHADGGV